VNKRTKMMFLEHCGACAAVIVGVVFPWSHRKYSGILHPSVTIERVTGFRPRHVTRADTRPLFEAKSVVCRVLGWLQLATCTRARICLHSTHSTHSACQQHHPPPTQPPTSQVDTRHTTQLERQREKQEQLVPPPHLPLSRIASTSSFIHINSSV
jgi:hypothetical protein